MVNGNGNGEKYTAEQMIEVIQQAEGNLTDAARLLQCSRTTMHKYVNKYATVRQAYEEETEKAVDFAEGRLMKEIRKGNITAIIFFLKTKGKHRGYVERSEIGGDVTVKVVYGNRRKSTTTP